MSGESYAPRSPDLSSFFASSSTSPAKAQGWAPLPPQGQGQGHDALPPSRPHEQPHLHLQPPPYYPPAAQPVSPVSPYSQQLTSHQPLYSPPSQPALLQSPSQNIYGLPGPPLQQHQQQYFPPYSDQQQYHEQRPTSSPRQLSYPPAALPYSVGAQILPQQQQLLHHQQQQVGDPSLQSPSDAMPPRRSAAAAAAQAIKQEAQQQQYQPPPLAAIPTAAAAAASSAAAASAAPVLPSPVRTKFPTARIKRIMQADDEVGKVAQQTPIAVGKALELFMVALVSKSAEVARDRGSKRVTAQMLKHVVETDEQWDFLRDIVGKVDSEEKEKEKSAGAGAKRAKAESESDEEVAAEKKKGRAGRKKKAS